LTVIDTVQPICIESTATNPLCDYVCNVLISVVASTYTSRRWTRRVARSIQYGV